MHHFTVGAAPRVLVLASLLSAAFATPSTLRAAEPSRPAARRDTAVVAPNPQRVSAGRLERDTLVVALDIMDVLALPEGRSGPRVPAVAFAERGHAPTLPGPLLRLSAGTPVRVSVRNTLAKTVQVRGLSDRVRGDSSINGRTAFMRRAPLSLAAGETREVVFTPSQAVSSFYYANVVNGPTPTESPALVGDIVGALVVDPANSVPPADEELFVVTLGQAGLHFNGLSWPRTPRLRYTEGQEVRWRVINTTGEYHPLHLHGFYFTVQARGDTQVDTLLTGPRPLLVTEAMREYSSMQLRWTANRAGNWLFHCHLLVHSTGAPPDTAAIAKALAAGDSAEHRDEHEAMSMRDGMAGLIMGITVSPRVRQKAITPARVRRLDVWTSARTGVFGDSAGLSFVLQRDSRVPAMDSLVIPSSPLLLTRGETTRIVVHNRLRVPLSLHWHGMELDSWYDGVGHWSGEPGHMRPPIAPGDSMDVYMTPPRAGTFMYHIHGESGQELQQGLYGALIVLEPGQSLKRDTDRLFVLASRGATPDAQVSINGRGLAPAERFTLGTPHRLRFMHISTNDVKTVRLLKDGVPVQWRALAQDGAELPPALQIRSAASLRLDVGQTFDFEWTPTANGLYVLEVATVPLLSAPETQRVAFGVGPVSDSALRVAATGTPEPLADVNNLLLARYTGSYQTRPDGEVLSVWSVPGALMLSRTNGGVESPAITLVSLANGTFVPATITAGLLTDVRTDTPYVLSPTAVETGRGTSTSRVYQRLAAFPMSDSLLARFSGNFENGVVVRRDGRALQLTGLGPAPLPLVPLSPSRLKITFPDNTSFVLEFSGTGPEFDGFTVIGVGFSVKRVPAGK